MRKKKPQRESKSILLLNIAACYLKLEESDNARQQCEKVLEEDPTSVQAHFKKGQALQITRDYNVAMKCFQDVVKLEPNKKSAQRMTKQRETNMYSKMFM